jgi:hypothetical protein
VRIEIVAQWRDEFADCWESMIASLGCSGVFTAQHIEHLYGLVDQAKELERGPIPDMAVNTRTKKTRYEERTEQVVPSPAAPE